MYPSDFADCGEPVRYTLLAALCWTRQAELVDGLVGYATVVERVFGEYAAAHQPVAPFRLTSTDPLIGEFEVVAAGMTADDPALLQGDDDLWVEVPAALGEGAWSAGDDVENCGCPGAHGRPEAAEPVQRDALVAGEITVAGAQAADGRAGGGGVGVDADAGAGQLPGEGGHRGAETVQGPAERAGERGHRDRDAGGTGGHGDGGQRGFQHGRVRWRLLWRQRAPVGGSCGRAEQFGGVKVEDLAQSFEEPQGHVVVIGDAPRPGWRAAGGRGKRGELPRAAAAWCTTSHNLVPAAAASAAWTGECGDPAEALRWPESCCPTGIGCSVQTIPTSP